MALEPEAEEARTRRAGGGSPADKPGRSHGGLPPGRPAASWREAVRVLQPGGHSGTALLSASSEERPGERLAARRGTGSGCRPRPARLVASINAGRSLPGEQVSRNESTPAD